MTGPNHVQIYDFASRRVTIIPIAELAHGYIEATVEGVEGSVWIDPATLPRKTPMFRHESLDAALEDKIREIIKKLGPVFPKSFENWVLDLRRDTHPEREISIWLQITDVYQSVTGTHNLSTSQRKELFDLILRCSTCDRKGIEEVIQFETLPRELAMKAIDMYYGARP